MVRRLVFIYLPRLLFLLAILLAFALFALVLGSPLLDNGESSPEGWERLLVLFARDSATRRTALACGVGLLVTAFIFFRRPEEPHLPRPRRSRKAPPPPTRMAGA